MTLTVDTCLAALTQESDATRAAELEAKFVGGTYLGTAPDTIENLARTWRQEVGFPERIELATDLWNTGTFEAQIMAAKLLTSARIKDDAAVWDQLTTWLEATQNWALIDALCAAGGRRLMADLSRMPWIEAKAYKEDAPSRRTALQLTLPLAKLPHPTEAQMEALDTACDWLPVFLNDPSKDVNRTADSWVRALKKHHFLKARMIHQIAQEQRG